MKGSSAAEELDRSAKVLRRLRGTEAHVETVGQQWLNPPVTVVSVRAR